MNETETGLATVLYVDDSHSNLLLFEELFKREYKVLTADSARTGLNILEKEKVDVLVSDQSMPGMSGNEFLEIANEKYPDLLSFILTAYTDYDSLVEAVNRGKIFGYFNKPIKFNEIRIAINRAMEVSVLRKKNRQMIEELEYVNKELLRLDKNRSQFLSMMTNEIRSPINKIMSAVHMIKDKVDSRDITELLSLLDISVSRLESFSYATNQLARIRDEKQELEMNDISLRELIEITFIAKKNALDESGIKTSMDSESIGAYVKGDYDLLLSCMGILLMNLVNSSDRGGEFIFSTAKKNGSAWLDIEVKNSGFSTSQLEALREIFSGRDSNRNNHCSLELILSKEIINTHKGEIQFESNGNGSFRTRLKFPAALDIIET
ncbi:MAG: hybrid sensor histidine kinase/response regulator [Bacteroidota bacterium]